MGNPHDDTATMLAVAIELDNMANWVDGDWLFDVAFLMAFTTILICVFIKDGFAVLIPHISTDPEAKMIAVNFEMMALGLKRIIRPENRLGSYVALAIFVARLRRSRIGTMFLLLVFCCEAETVGVLPLVFSTKVVILNLATVLTIRGSVSMGAWSGALT